VANDRILIADDEEAIREVVATLLEAQGYQCATVGNGRQALDLLSNQPVDLVLSDMVMPEMDGLQLLSWLRTHDRDIPVIMVTAMHDVSTALEAMRRGAYDYILKPFERDQLLMGVRRGLEHRRLIVENRNYQKNLERLVQQRTAELKNALSQLEESYDETLEALGGALDLKDSETEGHCKRVMVFTLEIAKSMGIEASRLPQLARAACLHDIGKMAIPDRILRKPGPLTEDERTTMRTHCEIGYKMLIRIPFLREAAEIVLAHQEYFDGSGYPRGLSRQDIPLGARIFAIADALDAMISDRPYRSALSVDHARREIERCAGTQFDPEIVEVFLRIEESIWLDLRENSRGSIRQVAPVSVA
jgi:putative nucleotidyltransferase with HDIG domain